MAARFDLWKENVWRGLRENCVNNDEIRSKEYALFRAVITSRSFFCPLFFAFPLPAALPGSYPAASAFL